MVTSPLSLTHNLQTYHPYIIILMTWEIKPCQRSAKAWSCRPSLVHWATSCSKAGSKCCSSPATVSILVHRSWIFTLQGTKLTTSYTGLYRTIPVWCILHMIHLLTQVGTFSDFNLLGHAEWLASLVTHGWSSMADSPKYATHQPWQGMHRQSSLYESLRNRYSLMVQNNPRRFIPSNISQLQWLDHRFFVPNQCWWFLMPMARTTFQKLNQVVMQVDQTLVRHLSHQQGPLGGSSVSLSTTRHICISDGCMAHITPTICNSACITKPMIVGNGTSVKVWTPRIQCIQKLAGSLQIVEWLTTVTISH